MPFNASCTSPFRRQITSPHHHHHARCAIVLQNFCRSNTAQQHCTHAQAGRGRGIVGEILDPLVKLLLVMSAAQRWCSHVKLFPLALPLGPCVKQLCPPAFYLDRVSVALLTKEDRSALPLGCEQAHGEPCF